MPRRHVSHKLVFGKPSHAVVLCIHIRLSRVSWPAAYGSFDITMAGNTDGIINHLKDACALQPAA
eukprot:scaffold310515_cov27-Prasinocladus_malaysianus.AAC.1